MFSKDHEIHPWVFEHLLIKWNRSPKKISRN